MPNKVTVAVGLLAVTIFAGTCLPQTEAPKPPETPKGYQLDFVVKELEDGKVINSRDYSMMVGAQSGLGSIRAGNKIPVQTKSPPSTEFTYLDVGVNIDCHGVMEVQGKLNLVVTADITSVISDSSTRPLIRSTKWSGGVVVPFRKSTVLFSSDDTTSKKRIQLELTAAPIS